MAKFISAIYLFSAISTSAALQVTPGSACADVCLDTPDANPSDPSSSNTDTADITCKNSEYSTTGVGTKYKTCLGCLMTSDSVDEATGETDVAWFLYNLRYAVDVCLYGFGNTTKVSSPCDIDTACLPLKNALLDGELEANANNQYDFCNSDDGIFQASTVNACASCLKADSSQSYLANFLVGLQAGCEQKPEAGVMLGLEGDLFSAAGVNITEPTSKDDDDGKGMSIGTIVGIAVGAALLFLGGTAMFIVYFRHQKNQNHDNDKQAPGTAPSQDSSSFQPAYPNDHKKSGSFHSEIELKHGGLDVNTHAHSGSFSSNADFYDKLEEVMTTTRKKKYNRDPHADALNTSAELPTHPLYIPKALSRGNTPSPVPPVLPPTAPEPVALKKSSSYRQPPPAAFRTRSPPPTHPQAPNMSSPPLPTPPSHQDHRSSIGSGTSGTKRANKPAPLQNINSDQKPSSWTLRKYLSNSEDTPIPIPPPPPMTGRSVMSQQSQQSQASNRSNFSTGAAVGTMTSQGPGTSGATLSPPLPPPPPGPPPASSSSSKRSPKEDKSGKTTSPRRIPHISIPSVPRIKVPKKYSPPSITVQGATPIEVNDITGPMDPRTMATVGAPRFPDSSIGHNDSGSSQEQPLVHRTLDSNGQVVETQLPMPSWRRFEAEEVQTGRSARLYG